MFFTHLILASLTLATALANHQFHALKPHAFDKRQEYKPDTYTCGFGETCEESCGAGSLLCSDEATFLCYNPGQEDTCCEPGSADSWGCPGGDYCLVEGYCCPKEVDPQACALEFGVTLPADFVGPTATPGISNITTPVIAPTSGIIRPTSASTGLPEFTGAASLSTVAGGNGLLYAVLVMVGNLF
ncbi:hypothetical protein ACET3X_006121 [Alternaria dauci]|uniref:Uncharacterized protein n=1 Tax=Alternaria dauci TaxID=48095 RepID=A0ABR3UI39_9PLEO